MMADTRATAGTAAVDFVVDENGERLDVTDDSLVRPSNDDRVAIASTGPTNWWRYGVIGVGIVALILLLMQLFQGTPGTDVQPGTPVAAPEIVAPGDAAPPAQQ
jgi:hypothetical protein